MQRPSLSGLVLAPQVQRTPYRSAFGPSSRPLLEAWGVTKRWRKRTEPILDGVDLQLERGTSTWVGGRNGIGKTTLLRVLSGLIAPDSGLVGLDDLHPQRDRVEYQRRIGLLTAGTSGLYARLSVRRNLEYWAAIAFVARAERASATQRAIERFDLGTLALQRVDRLSMGQRQRVRLALTFLHGPEVVLLDEPRTSLDEEGVAVLVSAVSEHIASGGAVLSCSPTGEDLPFGVDARFRLSGGRLEEL